MRVADSLATSQWLLGWIGQTTGGTSDHGKENYSDSVDRVRIRVWVCSPLEWRHRDDWALPRSGAQLQLRAATASAAPCLIRSSSGGWGRRRPGVWLLRTGVRVLWWPPILRPTRLLAWASSFLAITEISFASKLGNSETSLPAVCRGE